MDVIQEDFKRTGGGVQRESVSLLSKTLMEERKAYLVLSKKSRLQNKAEIQKIFTEAIEMIRRDGTGQKILDKHLE